MSVKMLRRGFLRDRLFLLAQQFCHHVPVVVFDAATFQQVQRYCKKVDRQWVRRTMAALNVFVLVAVLASWMGIAYHHYLARLDGDSSFGRIVIFATAVSGSFSACMALFYSKWLYWLAGTSMDDLGLMEYGIPYCKLTATQRRPLMKRNRTELLKRCFYPDERQAANQHRAELAAFRLLRRTAILVAAGVWAAYLIAPARALGRLLQSGEILVDSPLFLSWLAIALVALPTLIRLWTEPDQADEPRIVMGAEREPWHAGGQ